MTFGRRGVAGAWLFFIKSQEDQRMFPRLLRERLSKVLDTFSRLPLETEEGKIAITIKAEEGKGVTGAIDVTIKFTKILDLFKTE
jgi:hypothetical protein